jgi:hypothetical protein
MQRIIVNENAYLLSHHPKAYLNNFHPFVAGSHISSVEDLDPAFKVYQDPVPDPGFQ